MKKSLGAKTLVYPLPVWVVGTYDKESKPNVATIAWEGFCCSDPPCVAISLRNEKIKPVIFAADNGRYYGVGKPIGK